jgi:hypothetical protein
MAKKKSKKSQKRKVPAPKNKKWVGKLKFVPLDCQEQVSKLNNYIFLSIQQRFLADMPPLILVASLYCKVAVVVLEFLSFSPLVGFWFTIENFE